ncbi:GyrI-like domain-containing protein [Vibrio quintilis]|uniref:Bacterial transcription activator, effector binding domain n=1 Tax=Vibrio quintilis TaxID=1117707 RepID=A0A1M7YWH6_9VIBR|nr:GyrI-like domain-containing protein [Vibrio quintilis]SHO56873.1 Bacterial transcription activator, effector binding domain [Vibrio quintilis]
MEPEIKTFENIKLVGCREEIDLMNGEFSGIGKAWERLFPAAESIQNIVQDDQFWGITTGINEAENAYTAAKQVSEISEANAELASFDIPAQQFAVFVHRGNPMAMGQTIQSAFQWLAQSDYQLSDSFNLEMYDSRCDPENPDGYIIDLLFPVQAKA